MASAYFPEDSRLTGGRPGSIFARFEIEVPGNNPPKNIAPFLTPYLLETRILSGSSINELDRDHFLRKPLIDGGYQNRWLLAQEICANPTQNSFAEAVSKPSWREPNIFQYSEWGGTTNAPLFTEEYRRVNVAPRWI